MRRIIAAVILGLGLAASGCGTATEPSAGGAPTLSAPVKSPPSTVAPTELAKQPTVPTKKLAAAAKPLTAGAVIKRLKAAGLPLSHTAVQDENTDPNNLIGRPNGYLSRASADLPGGDSTAEKYAVDRGMVVEEFPEATAARARSDYIQNAHKAMPILGTEWHYMADRGKVLVRITGDVKPSLAGKIEAAVARI